MSRILIYIIIIFPLGIAEELCGYLLQGIYYARDLLPDASSFPPHIPRGSFKIVVQFRLFSYTFAELHLYIRVVDKPIDWNKIPKFERYQLSAYN
ncbi:hypothetical protein ILUMI_05004 [Ignelater luminosus]|uniref:Uncharacterized protein n=1 Tax=Ignelater luminosus TaxID=2038154 RepID=A0A8K0GJ23_IGNLU|nr:hypothetical protein ILUMI_05004 [Ignelater luminosus]